MNHASSFRSAIANVHAAARVEQRPFFVALRDGSFPRSAFIASQEQFFHAVVWFSRPMLVLAARLDDAALRVPLIDNAWEEHGEGRPGASHEATFRALLRVLGQGAEKEPATACAPVLAFNYALQGVCAHGDPLSALATLGMIEDMFAGISTRIGEGIVANEWADAGSLVHYATHEELDVAHSEAFYAPLEARWAAGESAAVIRVGLELGGYLFMRFYDDLYAGSQGAEPRASGSEFDHESEPRVRFGND